MTWGDIQLSVLHKLFVSDGQTILVNDSTSPYIAAMPLAANEGLMLLAACGKYIPKENNRNGNGRRRYRPQPKGACGKLSFAERK